VRTRESNQPPAGDSKFARGGRRRNTLPRYFLPAYILLIVYVSLSPFSGWLTPEHGAFQFLVAPWPRYITAFDVLANILAYMPVGMLLFELLVRRVGGYTALAIASLGGCLLSFTMESLQAYLPVRVSSLIDLLANTAGTICGAIFAAQMGRSWLARWMINWRHETFSDSSGTEFGEVLLAIWLFIQLNPSIPFFAAGTINSSQAMEWNATHSEPIYFLPQGLAVALNVCGFGLFSSVLLRPSVNAWRFAIGVIGLGIFLKTLAAGVLLKPPVMLSWFGKDVFIGVIGGLLLLWLAARMGHRWRIYVAAMTILAGGLLAKIAAIYDALSSILNVFSWSHGQLFNFTSATLLLNEFWPLVALAYLLISFDRLPSSDSAAK